MNVATPQASALDELTNRASVLNERLAKLATQATEIADSVFGGQPTEATPGFDGPKNPSRIETIAVLLDCAERQTRRLREQLERLSRL